MVRLFVFWTGIEGVAECVCFSEGMLDLAQDRLKEVIPLATVGAVLVATMEVS